MTTQSFGEALDRILRQGRRYARQDWEPTVFLFFNPETGRIEKSEDGNTSSEWTPTQDEVRTIDWVDRGPLGPMNRTEETSDRHDEAAPQVGEIGGATEDPPVVDPPVEPEPQPETQP